MFEYVHPGRVGFSNIPSMKMFNSRRNIHSDKKASRKRTRNSQPGSKGSNKPTVPKESDFTRLQIASRSPFPLPPSFRTTLRYYEQVNLVSNSTPFVYVFRANSGFDPNQTGSGSQPVGWDNLLAFYNASFGVGSRININVINGTTVPVQFGVAPTIASTTISSYDNMKIYGRQTVFGYADGTTRGSSSVKAIQNEVTTLRFFNQPFDRDFVAAGQALPSKNLFWSIVFQTSDQTTLISLSFQVEIFYDFVFTDPLLVPLS